MTKQVNIASLNSTFSVTTSITAHAILNFAFFLHNNVEFPLDVSSVSQNAAVDLKHRQRVAHRQTVRRQRRKRKLYVQWYFFLSISAENPLCCGFTLLFPLGSDGKLCSWFNLNLEDHSTKGGFILLKDGQVGSMYSKLEILIKDSSIGARTLHYYTKPAWFI